MVHRTLVIPDIHHNYRTAEQIIEDENPDLTVFLGDYFDDFYDNPGIASGTARWLAKSLESDGKDRIHLIGNHDLHYMSDNRRFVCSGYSGEKKDVIRTYNIDWSRLKMYYWIGETGSGWLCTHAGFSNRLFRQQHNKTPTGTITDILRLADEDLENAHNEDMQHPFLSAGYMRGGPAEVGGLLWCDYAEFEDIPHTRQIFGHTRGFKVRHKSPAPDSEHYCIDTELRNYAICKDYSTMTIKSVN